MSEKFQKTYISVREFVDSWDKEIYELTNLDYFIFLMINHLGNQLDKRFFNSSRHNSPLQLSFDYIGSLCFGLGDSFECFLEDNGLENYYINHASEIDSQADASSEEDDERGSIRLKSLKAILSGEMLNEKNFRIDLMDHVILDTLLQFYSEELSIDINEDEFELIELADFIEDVMIDFIRREGKTLIERPTDSAIDYFEQLLESDDGYEEFQEWNNEEEWRTEEAMENSWPNTFEDVSEVAQKFIDDKECNPPHPASRVGLDIELFREYLLEGAQIQNIHEFREEHLLEFLSVWLVQKFAQEDEKNITQVFQTMARFITWLSTHYDIDYKRPFLKYYERVKIEVPRVVKALNLYLNECNLFEVLLLRDKAGSNQMCGFYEIRKMRSRFQKTLDLMELNFFDDFENIELNSSAYSKLKVGDVLQASLIQNGDKWEILEIHYIYPKVSKRFIQ